MTNSLEKLQEQIPDLKTANENNEILIHAFYKPTGKNKKKPVKINGKSHSTFWQKQADLKKIAKYKNLGLNIGADPEKKGQHLGVLDIDGFKKQPKGDKKNYWYDWDYHKLSCKLLFDVLKDIDIDFIPEMTWSGGFHLFFISKEQIDNDLSVLKYIKYPSDWKIKELQDKGITETKKTLEVITKKNVKIFMTSPSYWYEEKLNPKTNKPERKDGHYNFINPPEKNLIRDLKPVEDIKTKLLDVFLKHGFTYDKEEHQKALQNQKTNEISHQPVKILVKLNQR